MHTSDFSLSFSSSLINESGANVRGLMERGPDVRVHRPWALLTTLGWVSTALTETLRNTAGCLLILLVHLDLSHHGYWTFQNRLEGTSSTPCRIAPLALLWEMIEFHLQADDQEMERLFKEVQTVLNHCQISVNLSRSHGALFFIDYRGCAITVALILHVRALFLLSTLNSCCIKIGFHMWPTVWIPQSLTNNSYLTSKTVSDVEPSNHLLSLARHHVCVPPEIWSSITGSWFVGCCVV